MCVWASQLNLKSHLWYFRRDNNIWMKRYKKQRCFKIWWCLWNVVWEWWNCPFSCSCKCTGYFLWLLPKTSQKHKPLLEVEPKHILGKFSPAHFIQSSWSSHSTPVVLQRCFRRALEQGSAQAECEPHHDPPSEELDSGVFPQKGR